MRASVDRILTTHVGALPAPPDLWGPQEVDERRLRGAVRDVVHRQHEAGVDIVNEGELTKHGNWVTYVNERLGGFQPRPPGASTALLNESQDWIEFGEFYRDALETGTLFEHTRRAPAQQRTMDFSCEGAVTYCGHEALKRQIECLRAAVGDVARGDAFLTSTAPSSIEPGRTNAYYKSQEEFLFAIADALSVEYRAIVDAGFNLQVDDAWLAALWDRIGIKMGLPAYKRYCAVRVEALNHALEGIPPERVRYHLCWGSWHGPHLHDIALADIVDVMLAVNAQTYLFEAANVRHEHEFALWKRVKLPSEKILAPGVVSHATALVEHPELVSARLQRFARIVGRERVIASTDCGLGLRCHPQIVWAKLRALAQGAELATKALWGPDSVA